MTLHQTNPNDDAIVESLPKQEEFYRAPAQITKLDELGMSDNREPNHVHA